MKNKQVGVMLDNSPLYGRKIDVFSRATGCERVYLFSTRSARTCKEAVEQFEAADRTFYMPGTGHVQVDKSCKISAHFQK